MGGRRKHKAQAQLYFLAFFLGTPEMISSSKSFRVLCSFDLKSGAYIAARSALINLVSSQFRKNSSFWNTLPCRQCVAYCGWEVGSVGDHAGLVGYGDAVAGPLGLEWLHDNKGLEEVRGDHQRVEEVQRGVPLLEHQRHHVVAYVSLPLHLLYIVLRVRRWLTFW